MILVTLGTQDKSFKRLLEAIDKQISLGNINDEIIVQAGHTKYNSANMTIFDFIPYDEFDEYIKKCNLLITHGGVGSIITGLKYGKRKTLSSLPFLFFCTATTNSSLFFGFQIVFIFIL